MNKGDLVFYFIPGVGIFKVKIIEWEILDNGFYFTKFEYLNGSQIGVIETIDSSTKGFYDQYFYKNEEELKGHFNLPKLSPLTGNHLAIRSLFDLGESVYYKNHDGLGFSKILQATFSLNKDTEFIFENMEKALLKNCYRTVDELISKIK